MILRQIKISELVALTESPEYKTWTNVPISPARAYSQSLNPCSQAEDIALVIALDEKSGELLGFAGSYPSRLQKPDFKRYTWNSCWWVAEGVGAEVSMQLFVNFLKSWDKNVAFSDLTDKTFKIIRSLGFCHCMERPGVVLDIRPGFVSRIRAIYYSKRKIRSLAKLLLYTGIPWLADLLAEIVLFIPFRTGKRQGYSRKPVFLDFPEEKDFVFMKRTGTGSIHNPESEELKMPSWICKPTGENVFLRMKYYFSSFAFRYKTFWLRWETDDRINALAMLSLRDGVLKTLYFYCEDGFSQYFPGEIMNYCFRNPGIRTIVTAQPLLTEYVSNRKFFILSRRMYTRYSAVSNEIMKYFERPPVLQDGDGDYRFT